MQHFWRKYFLNFLRTRFAAPRIAWKRLKAAPALVPTILITEEWNSWRGTDSDKNILRLNEKQFLPDQVSRRSYQSLVTAEIRDRIIFNVIAWITSLKFSAEVCN